MSDRQHRKSRPELPPGYQFGDAREALGCALCFRMTWPGPTCQDCAGEIIESFALNTRIGRFGPRGEFIPADESAWGV